MATEVTRGRNLKHTVLAPRPSGRSLSAAKFIDRRRSPRGDDGPDSACMGGGLRALHRMLRETRLEEAVQ
jgi:hypothetical protein